MPSETIGDYSIEYAAMRLPNSDEWGAWVTIYGPSHNPMHRNPVFPGQRVLPDCRYSGVQAAEAEAKVIAHRLVEERLSK